MADLTTEDWDEILGRKKTPARAQILLNQEANPDKAGEALKLGKDSGISPALISDDQENWKVDLLTKRKIRLMEGNKALENYIVNDPMNAKVSNDDFDALDQITRMANGFSKSVMETGFGIIQTVKEKGLWPTAAEAGKGVATKMLEFSKDPLGLIKPAEEALARQQYQRAIIRWQAGDPAAYAEVEEWERRFKALETSYENGTEKRANLFQEVFGQFIGQTIGSSAMGVKGAVAGALAGTVAAGPIGFTAGAIGGFGTGFVIDQSMLSAANQYRRLDLAKGPNGETIPEGIKYTAAAATGLLSGALEGLQLKFASSLVNSAISRVLADKVAYHSLSMIVKETAMTGIKGGTIEVGQGLAEDLSEQIALIIADIGVQNLQNATSETMEKIGQNAADNFIAGFILTGTLGGLGAGIRRGNPVGDSIHAERSKKQIEQLDIIMQVAEANKTRQRSPDKFAEAMSMTAFDENLQLPLSIVKQNKVGLGFIQDLEAKIAEAEATGTEVEVKLSRFAAYVDLDLYQQLRNDIRVGPIAYSLNEASVTPPTPRPLLKLPPEAEPSPQPDLQPMVTTADIQQVISGIREQFGQTRTFPTPEQVVASLTKTSQERVLQGIMKPQPVETAGPPTGQVLSWQAGQPAVETPRPMPLGPDAVLIQPIKPETAVTVLKDTVPSPKTEEAAVTREELISAIWTDTPKGDLRAQNTIMALDPTFLAEVAAKDEIVAEAVKLRPKDLRELFRAIDQVGMVKQQSTIDAKATVDAALDVRMATEMKASAAAVINALPDGPIKATIRMANEQATSMMNTMWLHPIIEDPAAVGMTKREFAAYSRKLQQAQKKLTKEVFDLAYSLLSKENTKEFTKKAAEIRPQIVEMVAERPELKATEMLLTGHRPMETGVRADIRLNLVEVDALFSREELDRMGVPQKRKLSSQLPDRMLGTGPGTMGLIEAKDWFGFNTEKEMLQNILGVQRDLKRTGETRQQMYARLVKEGITDRLLAEHMDLQAEALRSAMDTAMNTAQLDVLAAEVKALAPDRQLQVNDIRNDLDRARLKMTVADASKMEKYMNLVGKYGKEAELALLAGDVSGAFRSKQLQYRQMLMMRAARELREEVRLTENLVKRYTTSERREVTDAGYDTRIRQLLESTGLSPGRDPNAMAKDILASGPNDLRQWIKKEMADSAIPLPEPSYLSDPTFERADLKKMRTGDFYAFRNLLEAMDEVGRDKQFVKDEAGKLQTKIVVTEMIGKQQWRTDAERYKTSDLARRLPERLRTGLRSWDASLLKPETLIDFLDQLNPQGPMNRFFFNPLKKGEDQNRQLHVKIGNMFRAIDHGETASTIQHSAENTMWLDQAGKPMKLTRGNMLAIALNWGNEGNRTKLINGFRAQGHAVDQLAIEDILTNPRNMTKENWDWVTGVWKIFDELMPLVEGVKQRTTGVSTKAVPASSFRDGFGRVHDGGFYPILESDAAHNAPKFEEDSLLDVRQFQTIPRMNFLEERIGTDTPLRLDTEFMDAVVSRIIHGVSYTEALINANKIINETGFMKAIQEAYGVEYADTIPRWLKHIANAGGSYDARTASFYHKAVKGLTQNAVSATIGFNLGTAAIHSGSAAINTFGELGAASFKAIMKVTGDKILNLTIDKLFRNPENLDRANRFALSESHELRQRSRTNEADLNAAIERWDKTGVAGKFDIVKYHFNLWAQSIISTTDYMSALIGWHGAYTKYMQDGLTHEDAVLASDKLVRNAHGGRNSLLDYAEVQRKDTLLAWTRYYGYFNHNYNQLRKKLVYETRLDYNRETAKDNMHKSMSTMQNMFIRGFWPAFWTVITYNVIPAVIHAAIRDQAPEDDEPTSYAGWMGKALVSQITGAIPIVRDLSFAVQHPKIATSIPAWGMFDAARQMSNDMQTWANEGTPKRPIQHGLNVFGYTTGFPPKNFNKWMQYLYDVQTGTRESPAGYEEFVNTLVYGDPVPPGHKKPGR